MPQEVKKHLAIDSVRCILRVTLKERQRAGHFHPGSLHKRHSTRLVYLHRNPFIPKFHRHNSCDKRRQSLHRLEGGPFHALRTAS